MNKHIVSFALGFLAATSLFLISLTFIKIPEYTVIYRVECKQGISI